MITYIKAEPTDQPPASPEPVGQSAPPTAPPPPSPSPVTNEVSKPPPKKSGLFLGLMLVLFFLILIAGISLYFLQSQTKTVPPVNPSATPEAQASGSPQATIAVKELLYVQNGNVFLYDLPTKSSRQLTTDGITYAPYQNPKFVRQDIYGATICDKSLEGTKAYTCQLVVDRLEGGDRKIIFKYQSQPNSNNYQIGGDIHTYSWSPDQSQIAYIVNNINDANRDTGGTTQIRLINVNSKEDILLKELPVPAGRGGSMDDERAVRFFPDGTKLLAVETALYPRLPETEDQGTLFVFDLTNNQQVWSKKEAWLANAYWLDSKTILAKKVGYGSTLSVEKSVLVKLSLENTDSLETVSVAENWFNIRLVDGNKVIYWSPKAAQSGGIELNLYDLATKTASTLQDNLLPQSEEVKDKLLVWQMQPCVDDECGMDFYNGVIIKELGFFDLMTKDLQLLSLSEANSGFDLR